jgi:hypothetical protein
LSRRVSLPAADELFRRTTGPTGSSPADPRASDQASADENAGADVPVRAPSGRVRHDEKMTVYVTADELLDIEHARLMLRRDHGLAVDRGRLVRQAIAIALADFELHRERSVIVERLTGS